MKKQNKTKKTKPRILAGMNGLGMPMFYCNCKNRGTDILGRENPICDKCAEKVLQILARLVE